MRAREILFRSLIFGLGLSALTIVGCARFPGLQWGNGAANEFQKPQQKFSPEEKAQLSFGFILQNVLNAKCVSCHGSSGGVDLENYQNVAHNIEKIKRAVFQNRTMPKLGLLSDKELAILWYWIELGAPEQAQNGQPEIPAEPLLATYDSISKNILQVRCLNCHSVGHSAARVSLTKENLLNSPLELVIPGNADESGLVIALERTDKKRMPPEKEGYSRLKDEQLKIIREWIINGAKD